MDLSDCSSSSSRIDSERGGQQHTKQYLDCKSNRTTPVIRTTTTNIATAIKERFLGGYGLFSDKKEEEEE
jgi:hypothetical protein